MLRVHRLTTDEVLFECRPQDVELVPDDGIESPNSVHREILCQWGSAPTMGVVWHGGYQRVWYRKHVSGPWILVTLPGASSIKFVVEVWVADV